MKSLWNEFQFQLREQIFGKIKIHRLLPKALSVDSSEEEFYRILFLKIAGVLPHRNFSEVWDIGSKNGSYLNVLYESLACSKIMAVEVDGKRRYRNGYRREDYLLARASRLEKRGVHVEVRLEDFRNSIILDSHEPRLFLFLFPFVSEEPCFAWGLPSRFARFDELIAKVHRTKRAEETFICSAHQGDWEREKADESYRKQGYRVEWISYDRREMPSQYPQKHDVFLACCWVGERGEGKDAGGAYS